MTTETILTNQKISDLWAADGPGWGLTLQQFEDVLRFARDIEQAVLRSPEVQALRKDAERYRCLRDIAEPSDWEYISHQSPEVIDVEIDELLREQL